MAYNQWQQGCSFQVMDTSATLPPMPERVLPERVPAATTYPYPGVLMACEPLNRFSNARVEPRLLGLASEPRQPSQPRKQDLQLGVQLSQPPCLLGLAADPGQPSQPDMQDSKFGAQPPQQKQTTLRELLSEPLEQQLHQEYKRFQLQFEKQWSSVLACSRDEVHQAESVTRNWQQQVMDKFVEHARLMQTIQRQMARIEAQVVMNGNHGAATRMSNEQPSDAKIEECLQMQLSAMRSWQTDRFNEILERCRSNEQHAVQLTKTMEQKKECSETPYAELQPASYTPGRGSAGSAVSDNINNAGSLTSYQTRLASDVEGYSLIRGWSHTGPRETAARWTAQDGPVQTCLKLLEFLSLGLVFLNIIFMGINVDIQLECAKHGKGIPLTLRYIDIAFMLAFVTEILIRIAIRKQEFFRSCFNIIDLVVVVLHCIEVLSQSMVSLSFMRFVRNFRILRALRLMRYIDRARQLRLVLSCLSSIVRPLFWLTVVMVTTIFLLALIITQLAENIIITLPHGERRDHLFRWYGSVLDTMWTLYMASNGAVDWTMIWLHFDQESRAFRVALGVCVSAISLFVCNVVTGIFVDAVVRFATLERESLFGELMAQENSSLQVIGRVLGDCTKEGLISRKRMKQMMTQDPEAVEALETLEIDLGVLDGVVKLLDENDTGIVRLDELLLAIMQLHAPANLPVTMMYSGKQIAVRFRHLQQQLDEQFTKLTYVITTGNSFRTSGCI